MNACFPCNYVEIDGTPFSDCPKCRESMVVLFGTICPECKGHGVVGRCLCVGPEGGHDPDCPKCGGSGSVICEQCAGTRATIAMAKKGEADDADQADDDRV